jgi:NADH-quinone oxidoreductase subunit G
LSYQKLAETAEQWPVIGRGDLYYGGTTYENRQGLGVQLTSAAQRGEALPLGWPRLAPLPAAGENGLLAVPITLLYDRGALVMPSQLLHQRLAETHVRLNPADAASLKIEDGSRVEVQLGAAVSLATARIDPEAPQGFVLAPRSVGLPIAAPAPVELRLAEKVTA